MSTSSRNPQRRYRRRILGWGVLLLAVVFAVGAFVTLQQVHDDLERRVDDVVENAGVSGVSASFSGQDGTLSCDDALSPATIDLVDDLASGLDGVRSISFADSCAAGSDVTDPPTTDVSSPSVSSTEVPTTGVVTTEAPEVTSAPPATDPGAPTLAQLVAQDPQFSQLASLLDQTGLSTTLATADSLTVLAPTDDAFDAAFEALGADAFESLVSDATTLEAVLLHHVTDGRLPADEFEPGPLTMLDGTDIEVDVSPTGDVSFTTGDITATVAAPATQLDIEAQNGVIHAIDQVLLPTVVEVEPAPDVATTSVSIEDGQITLVGVVATAEQRDQLLAAVTDQAAAGNVLDQLTVDDQAPVANTDIVRLARLVEAMPRNLVAGSATLTGPDLRLTGVHTGDDASAAVTAIADEVGAVLVLDARPVADPESAQLLQDELNEFVRSNPILFEPNSFELSPEASGVLEQIAARAQRFTGVEIVVVGHTDSVGDAGNNLVLSEGRANAVLTELVLSGVPEDAISSIGRGETELVLNAAGIEDRTASRRVEFEVRAQ